MYDNIYDYHVFFEGSVDISSKLNEGTKISLKNMNDIQKALKAGEYNNARRNLETIRRSLADIREDIERANDNDVNQDNYKAINIWCIKWLKSLINYILSDPSYNMNVSIKTIRTNIDTWNNSIEDNGNLNVYKNISLERINYLISMIKMMDKSMEQLADTKGKRVKATATEITSESFIDDYVTDYVYEGGNIELYGKYRKLKKIYKEQMKNIQKNIKAENYKDAKKGIQELRENLKPIRKDIFDTDASSTGSAVFGFFSSVMVDWVRSLTVFVLAIPTFGLSIYVDLIAELADLEKYYPSEYNKKEFKKDNVSTANLFQTRILTNMNKLDSILNKLEKEMDKRMKNQKKAGYSKESAVVEFKKALYEACNHGLISTEQREELLESSRTNMYIEEASSTNYGFDTLSNEDQFKQVRRVLYERCKAGEISIDERDEMLLNARRKYF